MPELIREPSLLINGEWVPGSGLECEVENPATEQLTPWDLPLHQVVVKIVPALAAGPSDQGHTAVIPSGAAP